MLSKARLKDGATLIVIAIAAAAISWGLLQISLVRQFENWVGDLRVALFMPEQSAHPKITIAAIDEQTLQRFPYRSPINREFLARLVQSLEQRGAKAIALDILFDQATEKEADEHLRQVMMDASIPIVASYADREQLIEAQQQFINAYLPPDMRGYANVVKDPQDGVVRHIFAGRESPDGHFIPGLAAAIAEKLGYEPPKTDIPLVYHGFPEGGSIMDAFNAIPATNIAGYPDPEAEGGWHPPVIPPMFPVFKDKIVLVGAQLTEIDLDMKKTPYAALVGTDKGQIPGVMIHAHALAQIMEDIRFNELNQYGEMVLFLIIALIGIAFAKIDIPTWARLSLAVVAVALLWVAGFYVYYQGGPLVPLVTPSIAFFGAAWIGDVYAGRRDREQKRFIKDAFSRYLPPTLVDQLVDHPELLALQGERRELTFIFTDVAGFTTISESLPPTTLGYVLNRYMDGMCRIILDHGGTIDKFIGDAVMAIFGAPVPQEDQAQRAVACVRELDKFAQSFIDQAMDENGQKVPFGLTRMGVHTGEATVGNFGSEQKFDYTALGDTVNASARLESLNKQFGTRVCVSIETVQRTKGFAFRPMGSVIVKGKSTALDIFTPVHDEDLNTPLHLDYNKAYEMMRNGDPKAGEIFARLAEDYDDPLSKLHAKRIANGEVTALMKLTEK